jgi:hypothetical protein
MLNKTFAIPLLALVLIGCSAGGADEAVSLEQTGSSAGKQVGSPDSEQPQARLASQPTDPRMKEAATSRRAVIRNASLQVRVENVEQAERKVNAYVASRGGFVVSSESSDLNEASATISLKIRIPVADFDSAMLTFESLGRRLSKKVSGEDVTAQLVDLDARLKIMRAQEDSFRNMLAKASTQNEALDLQTRIMELRGQIESLGAQRKSTGDLAALSTIELSLVGQTKGIVDTEDKGWAQESWNSATNVLGSLVRGLGTLGIFLLVLAPIWLPLGLLGWRALKGARAAPR